MRKGFIISLILNSFAFGDINYIDKKIEDLEIRLQKLESQVTPLLEEYEITNLSKNEKYNAMQRFLLDADFYSRNQLIIIEKLYKDFQNKTSKSISNDALNKLRITYPNSNRTGCAHLTYALSIKGKEKQRLLIECIDKYKDCYFLDGVNVGAYAKLYLALALYVDGYDEKADLLIMELRNTYPHAIDHNGRRLIEHFDELKSILPGS